MISKSLQHLDPNCAETFAALRLYGDDLDPQLVTQALGLSPSESAVKGLEIVSSSGKKRVAPTGRWILESEGQVESTILEQHIEWLLLQLEITKIIPTDIRGVTSADILCYWESATGHGGPQFSPELLGRIAKLRLSLSLDIYFAPPGS
jgi:hypothetical protein